MHSKPFIRVLTGLRRRLGWVCLLAFLPAASAQISAPEPKLLRPRAEDGWVRLNSASRSNALLTLEASTNLAAWQPIAILHDGVFEYPDAASAGFSRRFYRLRAAERGPDDDGKNQLLYPTDPFRTTNATQGLRWVKFAILLDDPTRVYYQDSSKYPFHYDFAAQRLAPFQGMDYASFDAVALHRANQQVVLGTVLYPPGGGIYPSGTVFAEYGVQFVGLDPYTPDEIARWFELVTATVHAADGACAYYMPTFEQSEMARTNAEAFAARGIAVASTDRWTLANHCYSAGWAFGRLKYFAGTEIAAAFADGRLRPEDILLTDGVPAETPPVAGIISLTPSTPNSHTAILSQSFGIPFVYLPDPAERARVQQLAGHKIILRATVSMGVGLVKVLDVEGQFAPAFESELLALKSPEPIQFTARQPYGAFSASTDTLTPADIQYFGGKAANFGVLRRSVPGNCPEAIAFSFDLWDAFLDQALPGGQTLRAEIAARLAPFTNYPPDIVSLKTNLAAIRDLFTRTARFTPEQQQAVTNALARFNPARKIRFRSSTNVEDTEHFTGAGLYDSFSGCLLDDLDADTAGPCQCDPAEANERGVFRAIQKVYASFFNDNAFLERLAHRVDESTVGMGVLVHYSFPDEEEMANGVATLPFTFTARGTNVSGGDLVTQLGAESVTNPNGTSAPEIVRAWRNGTNTNLVLKQSSSLVPLGAYVMDWPADYKGFMDLFAAVAGGYRQFYPAKSNFFLDFEYKKDTNLALVVKQVRQVPNPAATNPVTAFLVDEPGAWSVIQAGGAVFGRHRLKSVWTLHTANLRLSDSNLVNGIYTEGSLEYLENGARQTLSGPLNTWPNASTSPSGAANYWTTGSGAAQRAWRLETTLTTNVSGSEPPIFTPQDFAKEVTVTYATPVPGLSRAGVPYWTNSETVSLWQRAAVSGGEVLQARAFGTNGLLIQTSFYWPKPPDGVLSPVTVPATRFVETRISGLTANPIVLTNYYSQTYSAFHHNFFEDFIFEPGLEPGLAPSTLAELQAANIQLIYVTAGNARCMGLYVMGFDQTFRAP